MRRGERVLLGRGGICQKQQGEHLVHHAALCASASHREMSELAGNLITNAVKYNRQGGRVEVNLTNENGAPCLRVFNTGEAHCAGIRPAYL